MAVAAHPDKSQLSENHHEHRSQLGSGINHPPTAVAPRFLADNSAGCISVCGGSSSGKRSPSQIQFGRAVNWGRALNFFERRSAKGFPRQKLLLGRAGSTDPDGHSVGRIGKCPPHRPGPVQYPVKRHHHNGKQERVRSSSAKFRRTVSPARGSRGAPPPGRIPRRTIGVSGCDYRLSQDLLASVQVPAVDQFDLQSDKNIAVISGAAVDKIRIAGPVLGNRIIKQEEFRRRPHEYAPGLWLGVSF